MYTRSESEGNKKNSKKLIENDENYMSHVIE